VHGPLHEQRLDCERAAAPRCWHGHPRLHDAGPFVRDNPSHLRLMAHERATVSPSSPALWPPRHEAGSCASYLSRVLLHQGWRAIGPQSSHDPFPPQKCGLCFPFSLLFFILVKNFELEVGFGSHQLSHQVMTMLDRQVKCGFRFESCALIKPGLWASNFSTILSRPARLLGQDEHMVLEICE